MNNEFAQQCGTGASPPCGDLAGDSLTWPDGTPVDTSIFENPMVLDRAGDAPFFHAYDYAARMVLDTDIYQEHVVICERVC